MEPIIPTMWSDSNIKVSITLIVTLILAVFFGQREKRKLKRQQQIEQVQPIKTIDTITNK